MEQEVHYPVHKSANVFYSEPDQSNHISLRYSLALSSRPRPGLQAVLPSRIFNQNCACFSHLLMRATCPADPIILMFCDCKIK